MKKIILPDSGGGQPRSFDVEKNLIIVGANGSGKSRFGSYIEQSNAKTKRISAQRYLQLSEVVQKLDFETAENQLKNSYKNQPTIQPQNDYQQVLISLFAQEGKRDAEFVALFRKTDKREKENLEAVKSIKEEVVDVWNFIFPHRPLKLEKDRVRAMDASSEFSGTEMSDGEKVGLYLISQILLAESDCILIIDEPELHLHKALMVRLWNKLELVRSDCTFIYITHDLDFAVSKPAGKTLWIKNYNQGVWEWKELSHNDVIPENLFLEMLGSRKPILFVEGNKGSLDVQIYQTYYEDFTVIPRGSCDTVIESVKGLKDNPELQGKKVFGLIDKDFRSEEQLLSLQDKGIYHISLNKIENLFLLPEIIGLVRNHLSKPTTVIDDIVNRIRDSYDEKKESIEFAASKFRIQTMLNTKFNKVKNHSDYESFKTSIITDMDGEITSITIPSKDGDIIDILKVYPYKGLVKIIQGHLDLANNGYKDLVLGFLLSEKKSAIIECFKQYLPAIPNL